MDNGQATSSGGDKGAIVPREQFRLLGPYVPPRTPTERRLADIWCKVLSMDKIGVSDKYEHLGGDSLLAASLFTEIEKTFNVTIPTDSLMEAPTIEQLARIIEAAPSRS